MPTQHGAILRGPWPERIDLPRLKLDDFLELAREHQSGIVSALRSVARVYELFSQKEDIWSDQCTYATTLLSTVSRPVKELSKLLETTDQLPIAVVTIRHRLLLTLQNVDEQVHLLSRLISAFATICQTPSRQMIKQRQEILWKVEKLLQNGEDILQQIDILFDQARFQERRLNMCAVVLRR